MCPYLHIVFTQTDTSHVQYLHALTTLSPIAQMGRGIQAERKGGECADSSVHAAAAVAVYIEVQRREPAPLPAQTVR